MKIRGKAKLNTPRKVVTLVRTTSEEVDGKQVEQQEVIQIRVRALAMGIDQKMFELFPEPVKPQDYLKNASGVIMRDPETKKTTIVDVETKEWREANSKIIHGRMAYILFHGIDDPSVDFEANGADVTKAEFFYGLFDRFVEFGLTMGDLTKLMGEITGLMNLSEDIETSKGN